MFSRVQHDHAQGGATGRVCSFYQQGRCKFGDNCKFVHPNANRPQDAGNRNNNTNNTNNQRPPAPGRGQQYNRQNPFSVTRDGIEGDLRADKPIWPFSAYGPGKDAPIQLFGGFPLEQSPEEMRLRYYQAVASGNPQPAILGEQELITQTNQQVERALGDLDGAVNYVLSGENQHPNRRDMCQGAVGNVFHKGRKLNSKFSSPGLAPAGNPPVQSGAFGQPSTISGGAFGQPSNLGGGGGGGGGFGQPSNLGQKPNPFGQPANGGPPTAGGFGSASTLGQKSSPFAQGAAGGGFGQPSALGAKSNTFGQPPAQTGGFGSPSVLGQGSAFGQPSAGAQASPFARAAQPNQAQQSPFVQAPQPGGGFNQTSSFGQPSTLGNNQQTGGFGQPSALGQQQNSGFGQPCGLGQQPQSAFSQLSTPAQNSTFGQPSAPGQNPGFPQLSASGQQTSTFGQSFAPGQQNKGFGQPSGPAQQSSAFVQHSAPAQQQNAFDKPSAFGPPSGNHQPQSTNKQTNGGFGHANTSQQQQTQSYAESIPQGEWITRHPNRSLKSFKGAPVQYVTLGKDGEGAVEPHYRRTDGFMERIWHPEGKPALRQEMEAPPEAYTAEHEAAYKFMAEQGVFKDGIMPEIAPKCDWIRWDL